MADDPWAAFRTQQAASPATADPWAAFRQTAPQPVSTATDVAQSLGTGLVKGAAETVMTPVTLKRAGTGLVDWGLDKIEGGVRSVLGMAPLSDQERQRRVDASSGSPAVSAEARLAAAQDTARAILDANLHKPQTVAGQYAQTVGEFAPGIVGGEGSLAGRLVRQVAVPAVTSETAGQLTKGTPLEPYARLAGGVAGSAVGARLQPSDAAIPGMTPAAAKFAATSASSPADIQAQIAALQKLGPDATLADVAPTWMGVARSAASEPETRNQIVDVFTNRASGANTRLGQDLNTALGPAPVPSYVESSIKAGKDSLGPEYDQALLNSRAVNTQGIANDLESLSTNLRGPARDAVQKVRGFLNIPGTDVLDPHPGALLETRHAIDGLFSENMNTAVKRQLTLARQKIDAELQNSVPGIKDVDAKYAELAQQSKALETGGTVLDTGKTALRPVELNDMLRNGGTPQGTMFGPSAVPFRMKQGARAEIDRVVGTKSNDPVALQGIIQSEGDWNRAKLGSLFGQDNAQAAFDALQRERTFANTTNRVTAGADTAMTNRFNKIKDGMGRPNDVPVSASVPGLAIGGVQRLVKALMTGNAARNVAKYSDQLGAASVATGPARDRLVQALLDYHATSAGTSKVRDALVRSLLTSGSSVGPALGPGG